MYKSLLAALALCTALAGCLDSNLERAGAGAAVGAGVAGVTGGNMATGAVIGGVAGGTCQQLGLC